MSGDIRQRHSGLPVTVTTNINSERDNWVHVTGLLRLCCGGVVALSVEYRTCYQEVVGSSFGQARGVKTHTYVPLFTKQYKLVPASGR